ncbi:MAG: succinylglutamate desuccinylase/aspartoacylase family protein [Saprospiraceae bacterium]|nr:succinylglutamate desuccinylase/aspartoacylase family protein [Saprospiraceae bacterium]
MVRIRAGRLPSGNSISIFTFVFRSKQPGPVILFLGGMHGDEINGVEIVRAAVAQRVFNHLKAGTVIAIPLLNIFGFINFSRDVPNGKDVNRSFPGSISGSLASRIAKIITRKILPMVDFGIDFHSGGDRHWNHPQLRYSGKDPHAKELALRINFPLVVEKSLVPKSLRKVARDQGKPILIYEGGEANHLDPYIVANGLQLIRSILSEYKMIDALPGTPLVKRIFKKTIWERAHEGGIVIYRREAGNWVVKGELLAVISDPFAQRELRMHASRDAYLLSHNNAPIVNVGDGMFHLAFEEEQYVSVH